MKQKYVERVKSALKTTSKGSEIRSSIISELTQISDDEIVDWLYAKLANDPRLFLEGFTKIPKQGSAPIRWRFNRPQEILYYATHTKLGDRWGRSVFDLMNLKSRQIGATTLEEGLIKHDWVFHEGHKSKVVTFEDSTAMKLKLIVDTMYLSAIEIFEELGFNPYDFLPFVRIQSDTTPGTAHELLDEDTGGAIEFCTQRAMGSGRSLTVNRMYWTEYSKWVRIGETTAGLVGSFSQDLDTPYVHTIDFTGQGIGNRAYVDWNAAVRAQAARDAKEKGKPFDNEDLELSSYLPIFIGRDDYDYSPEYLVRQRQKLGHRKFRQEYPEKPEDAFLQDDNAVFDAEQIEARAGDKYLCELMSMDRIRERTMIITCDPAEGVPNGSNTAIKIRDLDSGIEAREPVVAKLKPIPTAHKIKEIWDEGFQGLIVVERNNHGHAVIGELAEHLGLGPYLYRHRTKPREKLKDCEYGWPQTGTGAGATKAHLESAMDRELAGDWIVIVSANGRKELRQYCLNPNGKTGRPRGGDDEGHRFYDDEAITEMLCCPEEVKRQAVMVGEMLRDPGGGDDVFFGGSMKDEV